MITTSKTVLRQVRRWNFEQPERLGSKLWRGFKREALKKIDSAVGWPSIRGSSLTCLDRSEVFWKNLIKPYYALGIQILKLENTSFQWITISRGPKGGPEPRYDNYGVQGLVVFMENEKI